MAVGRPKAEVVLSTEEQAQVRPETAPQQELQAFHRSVLRRESARGGATLPQSGGHGAGAVRGREEPRAGPRTHCDST